ncbi:MAG: MFS transporter [Desulfitibacter sp. BRH_c19]|nr:MAG: MFS transporter [Desulfitibacter sp. BRH_c19]
MNNKEALWTKDFILICILNLLVFTSFYFLLPTLPIFVTDVLNGNESQVGYIIGILTLVAVLVRPLSGYLIDAIGRKQIFFLALVGYVISIAGYTFVTSLFLLFSLRIFHGLAWGFTTTAAGTIVSDIMPPSRRGEGMGYYGLSNTLAMAVGPVFALLIVNQAGFDMLFSSALIFSILGLICMFGIKYPVTAKKTTKFTFTFESFYEPKVLSLSLMLFFVTFGYGGIVSFITIYAKELNIDNPGIFFFAYAIALLFVRPYAGSLFDKKGPKKIMAIGFIAIILSFIVLFLAKDLLLYIISALILGIGFGIVHPTAVAMAINKVEPFRRGAANATVFSAFDLGIGLGSILLGYLSRFAGLSVMYLICGLIIVIPLWLFYSKVIPDYYSEKNFQ